MHFLRKFSPENELPEQRNFELINITKIQILKIFYHLPYCKFLEKWCMFSLLYEEYMYFIFILKEVTFTSFEKKNYHLTYCKFLEKWCMFSLIYEEYMSFIYICFGEIFYFSVINRDIFFSKVFVRNYPTFTKISSHFKRDRFFYFGPKFVFLSL